MIPQEEEHLLLDCSWQQAAEPGTLNPREWGLLCEPFITVMFPLCILSSVVRWVYVLSLPGESFLLLLPDSPSLILVVFFVLKLILSDTIITIYSCFHDLLGIWDNRSFTCGCGRECFTWFLLMLTFYRLTQCHRQDIGIDTNHWSYSHFPCFTCHLRIWLKAILSHV